MKIFCLVVYAYCFLTLTVTCSEPAAEKKLSTRFFGSLKKKTIRDMNFEELCAAKKKRSAAGDHEAVLLYLERMIKICDDIAMLGDLLLEFSDTLFALHRYEKASMSYQDFTLLYPGHASVEYALYRAIVCSWKSTLDAERDQTKTEETVALCQSFLVHAACFRAYRQEVDVILTQCYEKLAQHDISVCLFYIKSEQEDAAKKRFEHAQATWSDYVPQLAGPLQAIAAQLYPLKKELDPGPEVVRCHDGIVDGHQETRMLERF
jgi:outer membrane assembly lipoprotein YfiO